MDFLRTVDAVEADTFRTVALQDFESFAVEDGDDGCCASLKMWTGPLSKEGDMGTAVKPVQNARGRR